MSFRWRLILLTVALCLVEIASFYKLSHWLEWTNEPWPAYTTGLAQIALLLAAIIALGSPIPSTIRRQFYLGGIWLFGVQALANVLIAFQFGLVAMPIDVVTRFFGVDPALALKTISIIQGATLSVCSISFWSVIAHLLQTRANESERQREQLRSLEQLMEEENRG